jgi:two-component system NarL family sensor kinase
MTDHRADQLQRHNRELSILNTIAQALNREVDLGRALHVTLAQVADLLDLHTGWIWLLRDGKSYLAASQNLPPALANRPHRMEGSCYCLDTFRGGDLNGAANVNVVRCSRLYGLADGTDGLRYHASIPLYAHGKKLGVLNVVSPDWRELAPEDLRLLYTIGDLVGIAIERARLYEQSVQLGIAEERNRLAREIHDTLAQGLAATSLQLEIADALLDDQTRLDQAQAAVRQALTLTQQNLEEARRSVLDLRAETLEGRSLPEALAELVGDYQHRGALSIELDIVGENHPLPTRFEAGLYRIAQEALNNVVQHATASQVSIKLIITLEEIQLMIADDGQGFNVLQPVKERFGLVGINERVNLLGGHLDLRSNPGEGTQLDIHIPQRVI